MTLNQGAGLSAGLKESLGTDSTRLIRIPGNPRRLIVRIIQHNSTQGSVGDFYSADWRR